MSLTADPPAAALPANGGSSFHRLVNGGADKIVFKVKSSNNSEYRITPVFGFVEPNGSTELIITRSSGPAKEDKLVIHYGPAPADATNAQSGFASVTNVGTVTIPVSAT